MHGNYDAGLVALSIVVAIMASYVALDLAARVTASSGTGVARYWLIGGALSMGAGIWSMHFIGMLAFELPIPVSYDIPVTAVSLLIAVLASAFALHTASSGHLGTPRLLGAGILMGLGIAAMHYTGMAAMQMVPPIRYVPTYLLLSIAIAIGASIAALWIAFRLRSKASFRLKAGAALIMGAAIAGMHYTGMLAAHFAQGSVSLEPQDIDNEWLAIAIGIATFVILITTLIVSIFDARLADRTAQHAASLQRANLELRESEARWRASFNQSTVGIAHSGIDGKFLRINEKFGAILGYPCDELLTLTFRDITHPADRGRASELRSRLLANETNPERLTTEKRYVRKDGTTIWANVSLSLVRKPTGEPDYIVTIIQDVSDRKALEERFRATFEQAAVGIAHTTFDRRYLMVNQKFCDLLGYTREELLTMTSDQIAHPDDQDPGPQYRSALGGEIDSYSGEKRYLRKDGGELWVNRTVTLARDSEGKPLYFIRVIEDITERKRAEERLEYLAQYDALTGLPNRSLFRDRLGSAMARAERSETMLAVMFIDLDRFKEVNDTLGHRAGDEVLQVAAVRLKEVLRKTDTIARLGGDEFTILLENIVHVDEVTQVAERVKGAFVASIVIGEREIFVTPSVGITLYPLDGDDVDGLLQKADAAMYHAKKMGRNKYEFYAPEMSASAGERLKIEGLLRRALERNELALHYQPKVETRTGRIVGVEALLRWNSTELGTVPPGQFIALAEETGLIDTIGEWVIRTACADARSWQDAGYAPVAMSVNLSPRQLRQENLVESIAAILRAVGYTPQLLEFEITETVIMENVQKNIAILKAIRALGATIALDDFGTGYSSLGYLAKLPVQTLKIDRSFVVTMHDNPDAMTLVSTILTLAGSLGLKVVAEGVETDEQLKVLRLLRCDEIQGYLVSKPVPAESLLKLLEHPARPSAALAGSAPRPTLAQRQRAGS